jgi:hypothetical protein
MYALACATPMGSLMSTPSRHRRILYQWADVLCQRLPLSKPQALGLALWSIGTVLADSGTLTGAILALSIWLGWPLPNLLKRLREWYLEAEAKKGAGTQGRGQKRRDWQVEQCAPALGRWILDTWPSPSVALALDATSLHDRFTVLAISLVDRRCAIPLPWTVLPGNTPGAWQPHWERMPARPKKGKRSADDARGRRCPEPLGAADGFAAGRFVPTGLARSPPLAQTRAPSGERLQVFPGAKCGHPG